jgi:hypothetical protein
VRIIDARHLIVNYSGCSFHMFPAFIPDKRGI